jgi:succinate-semialdehyde dehydrogenase/glutarate-semialdehyde dehydrogenase
MSPTRFFVEDAIYDSFADAFATKARTIKVGNGLDPDNQMGPLANERRVAAMETLVADAKAKGARITAGGERIGNRGYYFPLTVLADVPDDARAMREEPFGPLALLSRVRNIDEAIEKANSVPYGLAAYAFRNSARNVDRLAEGVEVGNLSINHFVASSAETPFGGVKDSGFGREGVIGAKQRARAKILLAPTRCDSIQHWGDNPARARWSAARVARAGVEVAGGEYRAEAADC